MPWLDPARRDESAEDRDLRAELRGLIGLPVRSFESNFFGVEPTPEIVELAEKLRSESLRRRNTARRRPMWMLLAAGLPVAMLISGLGVWGVQQKHKADALTAAAATQKTKTERANDASQTAVSRDRDGQLKTGAATPLSTPDSSVRSVSNVLASAPHNLKGTGTTTFTPTKPSKRGNEYPVIEVKQPLLLPPTTVDRVKAQ